MTQTQLFEHPTHNSMADGQLKHERFILSNREKKGQKNVRAAGAQLEEELYWLNYNLKHRAQFVSSHQRRAWRSRKTQVLNQLNSIE